MITVRTLSISTLVLACAAPALCQPSIAGRVKSAAGAVFVVRQNAVTPVAAGQALYEADTLRTGADGRVGVMLKDETRLALGPNTEVRLDKFLYAPGQGRLGFVLKIARGVIAYVSGRIAKLSPEAVRLETPAAILGVRGTRLVIRVEAP
jgi:hypothetical protein